MEWIYPLMEARLSAEQAFKDREAASEQSSKDRESAAERAAKERERVIHPLIE